MGPSTTDTLKKRIAIICHKLDPVKSYPEAAIAVRLTDNAKSDEFNLQSACPHESMLFFAFSVANVVSQSDYSKVVRIACIANAHRVQPSSKAQKKNRPPWHQGAQQNRLYANSLGLLRPSYQ